MRNVFRGGPEDGKVYLTSDIFASDELITSIPWEEYDGDRPAEDAVDGELQTRTWIWKDPVAPIIEAGQIIGASVEFSVGPVSQEVFDLMAGEDLNYEAKRKSLKLSRKQFAELSGLTESAIYRIENGKGKPEEYEKYSATLSQVDHG